MNNKGVKNRYYAYRLKLEKLKLSTWRLVVIARVLLFLDIIIHYLW